ncbi:MAG TPA: nucleotidyltransferase family protein [Candidatus Acidoferrales bacterium]|nr:nucleotidyltransferase family protein [Candidatus Acidoferrales bacterium]
MNKSKIFPILLAAGKPPRLPFPKALAEFAGSTAIEIAVKNCQGLERPIVVLGYRAGRLRRAIRCPARFTVNRKWRTGQLSSLLAGLRKVPRDGALLIYPVDLVFLTPGTIRGLVAAFRRRTARQAIVMPVCRRRDGHPVILAPELRRELRSAKTAREVVNRDARRIKRVRVQTFAIWKDFDTPASYARLRREFTRHRIG